MVNKVIISVPCLSEEYNASFEELGEINNKLGGIYFFYNEKDELLYLGKAKHLRSRIQQHLSGHSNTKTIKHNFKKFRVMYEDDVVSRDILETYLINDLKPLLNYQKVYTYKNSLGDDSYYTKTYLASKKKFEDSFADLYLDI